MTIDIRPYIVPNKSRIFYDPIIPEGQQRYIINKLLEEGEKVIAFTDTDYGCPSAPWNNQKYYTKQVAVVSEDWY